MPKALRDRETTLRVRLGTWVSLANPQKASQRLVQLPAFVRLQQNSVRLVSRAGNQGFPGRYEHDDGHCRALPFQFRGNESRFGPVAFEVEDDRIHQLPPEPDDALVPAT